MPANRSRTDRWRECLQQVYERGGGLEFSVRRAGSTAQDLGEGSDLVWRVRIVGLTDEEIVVERPTAMGQPMHLGEGVSLVAVLSIGQNRWMFETRTLGPDPKRAGQPVLRIAMPTSVERCRRREFYRMSAVELRLPDVTCWPLLDPASAVAAEVANRTLIIDLETNGRPAPNAESADSVLLPEVAPPFGAKVLNIGGGGVGIKIGRNEASALERARMLWLRIDLTPHIPVPLGLTARVVHSHRDSEQNVYAGLAFEFSFHASHKEFAVKQISRYVAILLESQRRAA